MSRRRVQHDIDETNLWYAEGIHIPTRTLRLMGGIDEVMAERVINGLHVLSHLSDDPIEVLMDTGGGGESEGLAIYDALVRLKSPLTITVVGNAWSMGAIILQAAKQRLLTRNASLMIHTGEKDYAGQGENVRREMLFDKTRDEVCDRILLEKMQRVDPKLTLGKLRDIMLVDTYYFADEAIRVGLADGVVE